MCDIVAYTKIYFHRFYFVFAFFSFPPQAQNTVHIAQPMLLKNVNFFFALQLHFSLCVSNLCPHFYFTLSIVEKWSQHIDLTELNRHILCSMHEERITMEKEKIQQHRMNWKRSAKKKCKSFVKWPKLGKLFTHTTYDCSNGCNIRTDQCFSGRWSEINNMGIEKNGQYKSEWDTFSNFVIE